MSASTDSWLLSGLVISLYNFPRRLDHRTKVGELDLANAVQTFLGGTQSDQCQVTLEANGLMGLSSDFDPASV